MVTRGSDFHMIQGTGRDDLFSKKMESYDVWSSMVDASNVKGFSKR